MLHNSRRLVAQVKHYGKPSEDTEPLEKLLSLIDLGNTNYITHFPKVEINARPCKMPGSIKVSAIMKDSKVLSVIKHVDGHIQIERNYT